MDKSLKKYIVPIISLCGLISCSLGLCSNIQGVFFEGGAKELQVMIGTFSMQNTISCIITYVFAVYFVRIMDRISYRTALLLGSVLTGMSFIVMGFTSNVLVFYILGIFRGIGVSVFAVAVVTIGINNWFKKKTGLVTSLVFCTSGITGMMLSPLFTWIIERYSWRRAYVFMGITACVLTLPALFSNFSPEPERCGFVPYGGRFEKENGEGKKAVATTQTKSTGAGTFWILSAIAVLYNIILGFSQHLTIYADSIGIESTVGAVMLSLCMFGNVLFKLFSGILADRLGALKSTAFMVSVSLASVLMLFVVRSPWVQKMAAFLFGVTYSVITVSLSLLVMEFYSREEYRRLFPKISLVGGIANPVAISLLGYIYDFQSSYDMVFVLLFLSHGIGLVLLFALCRYRRSLAA